MTPEQIALVKESFAKVEPISEQAGQIFYARLFEIAPEVRVMFRNDMNEQGRKLMATLGMVTSGLDNLDKIVPVAAALARLHVPMGVRAEHYEPVGEALIYTLEQGLGDDLTAETRAAWSDAYALLSGAMIAAAYPEQEAER